MSNTEKIAVFANTDGSPAEFYSTVKIDVYVKDTVVADKWFVDNTIELAPFQTDSIAKIRNEALKCLSLIDDCVVIVVKEITGIPYTVFDMAGKSIFTTNEISSSLLTEIIEDIISAERSINSVSTEPVETADGGFYYMDLVALQKEFPEISSKKALKNFLENTPFMELKLKCGHIPPWIENSGLYDIETQNVEDYIIAVLKKKQFH